jgi:hypothetical protein
MSKDHFFSVDIIDVNNDDDNNNIEVQEKKAEFGVTLISKEDISKLFSGRKYGQIWMRKKNWF